MQLVGLTDYIGHVDVDSYSCRVASILPGLPYTDPPFIAAAFRSPGPRRRDGLQKASHLPRIQSIGGRACYELFPKGADAAVPSGLARKRRAGVILFTCQAEFEFI